MRESSAIIISSLSFIYEFIYDILEPFISYLL